MEMKALSLKYSNPVLSQIQGCAIFLRYWVKLLSHAADRPLPSALRTSHLCFEVGKWNVDIFLHCGTYNFGLFSQRVWQGKVKLGTGAEEGSNTLTGKLHTDRYCQESDSLVDSGSVLFWDCYSLLLLSKKEGAGVRTCSNKNWKTTKLASKQSNLMQSALLKTLWGPLVLG